MTSFSMWQTVFLVVYLDDVDSNAYLFLISVRVLVGHAGLG